MLTQDPAYHLFADGRTLFGLPNFWNVVSNTPFLAAALYGWWVSRYVAAEGRWAFVASIAGTAGVGIGSSYYHWAPSDARLFWDRLPMTVVFMSLVASTVGDRVSRRAAQRLFMPLITLGLGSVLWWRWSGDLLPYAVVQFGSMLALSAMLLLFPSTYLDTRRMWWMVGLYGLAKMLELFDHEIALMISTGGHPWKHLAAAAAVFVYVDAIRNQRPLRLLKEAQAIPAPAA